MISRFMKFVSRAAALALLVVLLAPLKALAHGELEYQWTEPAYRREIYLQLRIFAAAILLAALVKMTQWVLARRRSA